MDQAQTLSAALPFTPTQGLGMLAPLMLKRHLTNWSVTYLWAVQGCCVHRLI